jgi:hypothetical protein
MQFYYKRTEGEKTFTDSFDLNSVTRTVEMEEGKRVVLLNDGHEESREQPVINHKTNVIEGYKRERNWYVSEIHLDAEDGARFIQLTKTN